MPQKATSTKSPAVKAAVIARYLDGKPKAKIARELEIDRETVTRILDVDLKARVAVIPRTKNGDQIVVPLNAAAMRALAIFRARGDGAGRVVRNEAGEALSVNAHWFVLAVREAGIKDFRWHDCRHTYASRLRQAGVPLGNIAELLGHKGLAMSRRYAHLTISNLHEAVSRIANSTPVAPESMQRSHANGYLN